MHPLIVTLKSDPNFRAMSPGAQVGTAYEALKQEFRKDPSFLSMTSKAQDGVLRTLALQAPTFNDPNTERNLNGVGADIMLDVDGAGLEKGVYEGWASALQASGAAGLVDRLFSGSRAEEHFEDRRRTLDYMKTLDTVAKRSDIAGETGAILGSLVDVIAVNTIMSPAVGAATTAIQASARGMTTAAFKAGVGLAEKAGEKALAAGLSKGAAAIASRAALAGTTNAVMKPALSFYGPIMAETLIEAVPYYLASEQKNAQAGKPTIISQGIGEVAKTLGMNAALDFATGVVATKLLTAAIRTGAKVFGKNKSYEAAFKTDAEFDAALDRIATGLQSPQSMVRMSPVEQASANCTLLWHKYVKEGIVDPDLFPYERAAFYGVRGGTPWLEFDDTLADGTKKTRFKMFTMDEKTGRPLEHVYENFNDLENSIAYRSFKAAQKMSPEEAERFWAAGGGMLYRRGETLNAAMLQLDAQSVLDADPVLANSKDFIKKPSQRPVITLAQADALAAGGNHVVKADIPLQGKLVENINSSELDLLRGKGMATVRPSDAPNAVFVGIREAPELDYIEATKKASSLMAKGDFPSVEEARASILLNKGFDHIRKADGSTEFFTTRAMRLIGTPEDVLIVKRKPLVSGSASKAVVIEESSKFKVTAKSFTSNPNLVLEAATNVVRKPKDTGEFSDFVHLYMAGRGFDVPVYKIQTVSGSKPSFSLDADGTWTLRVPSTPPVTFKDEKIAVHSILSDLEKYGEALHLVDKASPKPRALDYWAAKVAKAPDKFTFTAGTDPLEWMAESVNKLGGTLEIKDNGVDILLPSTGLSSFSTKEDALNFVARRTLDPATLRNDLMFQGITLHKIPSGGYIARTSREGKYLADGALDAVLDKIGYVPSSLDITYGPKVVGIRRNGIEFAFSGRTVAKDQAKAMELLSQFKDQAYLNRSMNVLATGKGTIYYTPNGKYRVHSNRFDYTEDFDSLGSARRFIETDIPSMDTLGTIADKKFLKLYRSGSDYTIVGPDAVHRVKNLNEVEDILRKYPDISESVPKVLDELDPTIESSVSELVNTWQGRRPVAKLNSYNLPPEFEANPDRRSMSAYMAGRKLTSTMNAWVEDLAQRTKNPMLRETYLDLHAGLLRSQSETVYAEKVLNTLLKGKDGKALSSDSYRNIYYHLAAENAEDAVALGTMYRSRYKTDLPDLTEEENLVAGHVKQYMASLSEKFQIDAEKLLFNYMPRLREYYDNPANRALLANVTMAQDLVDYASKGKPTKEMKFWAENERLDEVARFWVKDDVREVLMLYTAQGNKKLYMNEPWKRLRRFAEETGLEEGIMKRLDTYRMQIMGSYHTPAEQVIEDVGGKLFRNLAESPLGAKLGMNPSEMEKKGKNILRSALSGTYFSTMGWKPWLALRNTMQPLITLAPRVGLDVTMQAYQDVLDLGEPYLNYLRGVGLLSDKPPIVNQVFATDTKMGRVMEKSLSWMKNSEDVTRAVAYRSAELRFDNAYKALQAGSVKSRQAFEELASLDIMEPATRDFVWSKIGSGARDVDSVAQAKHEFASRLVAETQFEYMASESPLMYQGAVGKLFGQFGSYSAGYRAAIGRMFKYASPAKRVEMVGRYLAITGSLWAAFEALKIRTNDFVPVTPSIFTGGPGFNVGLDIIRSADTGYKGAIAREQIKRELPRLLPGASAFSFGSRALEYADKGDGYGAFLSLASVPHIDD